MIEVFVSLIKYIYIYIQYIYICNMYILYIEFNLDI